MKEMIKLCRGDGPICDQARATVRCAPVATT
jgi:hypothetical protein